MSQATHTLPGRLGDPNMSLATDPRVHPKLRDALVATGMDFNQKTDLPETFTIESLKPIIETTHNMTSGMYEAIPNDLPEDASEPEIQTSEQTIKGVDDNDIKLYFFKPVDAAAKGPLPAVLYSHGGGMVTITTNNKTHRRWAHSLAAQGIIAVMVDFRNAYTAEKHNPFPAGLNDCAAAAKYLAENRASLGISKLILQGESGGANLAITTALKANRENWIDQIAGVYGTVPYISGGYGWSRERQLKELPSMVENDGYLLGLASMSAFAHYYGPEDLENSHAWPYYASVEELRGLPPVVLDMNELDPLRDEGMVFYRKLAAAGVRVDAKVSLGIVHGTALVLRKALPEVHNAAVRDVVAFAKSL